MTGIKVDEERLCFFCGARFRFTGTGFQHPYRLPSDDECFFNGVHIGLARMPSWDRGVTKLKEQGVVQKPQLPLI